MEARALREHLEDSGFRLTARPDGLAVEPRSALTTETRQLIRAHRAALIDLVSREPRRVTAPEVEPGRTFWRFDVQYPNGTAFDVRTLPEATESEARNLWPGAVVRGIE